MKENSKKKNSKKKIKGILAIIVGICIVLTGIFVVVIKNKLDSQWKEGVYFIRKDVGYNEEYGNELSVSVNVIVVGDEIAERLTETGYAVYLMTDEGEEKGNVFSSGKVDKGQYCLITYDMFIKPDKNYTGLKIADSTGEEYVSPQFHVNISSGQEQLEDSIFVKRYIDSTKGLTTEYLTITNESNESITITSVAPRNIQNYTSFSSPQEIPQNSTVQLQISYATDEFSEIVADYSLMSDRGELTADYFRFFYNTFWDEESVLEYINNYGGQEDDCT